MKIVYKTKKGELRGEGNVSFFLADRFGGYLSLGCPSDSHYNGWFTFLDDEWELFKIIEDISIIGTTDKIINKGDSVQRNTIPSEEKFWVEKNAIVYTVSDYQGPINVFFDLRRIHDFDDKGRIYEQRKNKDFNIVHYKKFYDNSLQDLKEEFFVAIKSSAEVVNVNKWIERNYSYDASRKTKSNFFVFQALNLYVHTNKENLIIFGFGKTEEEAISICKKEYKKRKLFLGKNVFGKNSYKSKKDIAIKALDNLKIKHNNEPAIFAGLPWFYQVWSRDELISLAGLLAEKKYKESAKIVLRQLETINEEGVLGNRWPHSDLASADGTGWLYKRISNLMNVKAFNKKQLKKIYDSLSLVIETTRKKNMKKGLIQNKPLETWMDTSPNNISDYRSGFRVEIQALHLLMYQLAAKIGRVLGDIEHAKFLRYEIELYGNVRKYLLKNNVLHDGLEEDFSLDTKIRPNVFLAYYIYPNMIKKSEWMKTFDIALNYCWLDWGGLSSISVKDPLFCEEHTGIDNKSYHRGDSWYFVNNIAAISMHHLDPYGYSNNIKKIEEASIKEMLFSGFSGQCAELSDAKKQSSKGCLAQAWSAATLIELIQTTGLKK